MKTDNKLNKVQGIIYSRIILSFLLTIFKLLTEIFENSTLLLADGVRSFSELLNEAIESLRLPIRKKPEDRSYNYGHGKILTLCLEAVACVLPFATFHTFSLGWSNY
jgi:divalent metal cation (Fe/Co/Zn/Cd) transporter